MRIEHFWISPSTAAEWEKDAKHISANAAAPSSTLDGTHIFGTVAIGHSGVVDMPEATGRFVAIPMETGETGKPIVYTHHNSDPIKPTGDAKEIGIFDRDALALVCVPSGPNRLTRGYRGLANNEITAAQLEVADRACEAARLPLPHVAGRPVKGPSWSDPEVMRRIRALETLEHC